MKLLTAVGQFIMSEWIWAITLGQHQVAVSIVLLCIAYAVIMRVGWLRSLIIAFVLPIASWMVLGCVALVGLHYGCGVTYVANDTFTAVHPLAAAFLLGMLYTGISASILYVIRGFLRHDWQSMVYAAACCYTIAAGIIYLLMPPW